MKLLLFIIGICNIVYAGERKRIYVLDIGFSHPYLQAEYICKNVPVTPAIKTDHGDNISSIIGIKINHSKYCVYPVNVFDGPGQSYNQRTLENALHKALNDPLAIAVNMSLEGNQHWARERRLLGELTGKGIKVIVAAGNRGNVLTMKECNSYPACYGRYIKKNFYVVVAPDVSVSNVPTFSYVTAPGLNRGIIKTMTGTSQACAEYTGGLFR